MDRWAFLKIRCSPKVRLPSRARLRIQMHSRSLAAATLPRRLLSPEWKRRSLTSPPVAERRWSFYPGRNFPALKRSPIKEKPDEASHHCRKLEDVQNDRGD